MSCVIAFIDQNTCKVYANLAEVPPGATTFSSPEELAKAAPMEALDRLRGRLLGGEVGSSSSREEAARKLWYVLSIGAEPKSFWEKYERRKDKLGNNKIADTSRIELIKLVYTPGKDYMADFFYKELPRQAKTIIDILHDDGRGIWTGEEAVAVVMRRGDEIKTRQGVGKILTYYMSELFAKNLIRRVSFAEFVARPEFSGVSIDQATETAT
jgi:hypothetical protein